MTVPVRHGGWRRYLGGMLALLWLGLVSAGMAALWDYGSRPGTPATPPATWPGASAVARATDRPTLVMLAHPRCPCTRASIGELDRLMARVADRVAVRVLFVEPTAVAADWVQTDLWASAAHIPGVVPLTDPEGREARLFGAVTSGQVVVYDADGRLVFHGGITPERGHAGDNVGRAALEALLVSGTPTRTTAPVFGCHLVSHTT